MTNTETTVQPDLFARPPAEGERDGRAFPPKFEPRNEIEVHLSTAPKFRAVKRATLIAKSKPPAHVCAEAGCGDTAARWVGWVGEAELTPYCARHAPEDPWRH